MPTVEDYSKIIAPLSADPKAYRLTRLVPFLSYKESVSPSFLYTSGRPNRCNPRNVKCIYFAQNKATAQAEYDAHETDPTQPTLTYHGRLKANRVIDLEDLAMKKRLQIPDTDFEASFYLNELALQRLGTAIAGQTHVCAIRYPSRAMTKLGKDGFNLAIFPDALVAPCAFVIYGQEKNVLEQWPPSSAEK